MRSLLAGALLAVGCQRSSSEPPPTATGARPSTAAPAAEVTAAYTRDIENLCDAEARSGAREAGRPNGPPEVAVARFLGGALTTPESKRFMVSLASLAPAAKGAALRAEAARAGLPGCALADTWK